MKDGAVQVVRVLFEHADDGITVQEAMDQTGLSQSAIYRYMERFAEPAGEVEGLKQGSWRTKYRLKSVADTREVKETRGAGLASIIQPGWVVNGRFDGDDWCLFDFVTDENRRVRVLVSYPT